MHPYPEAYDRAHLEELLDANDSHPAYINGEVLDRLLDIADQRADAAAMQSDTTECLITTTWGTWATDELGFDGGSMNQAAFGELNWEVSQSSNAALFENTVVAQDGWLTTGDGRKTKLERYEDTEFDAADIGDLWIPDGAQDYICIIELTDEFRYDDPDASDAM